MGLAVVFMVVFMFNLAASAPAPVFVIPAVIPGAIGSGENRKKYFFLQNFPHQPPSLLPSLLKPLLQLLLLPLLLLKPLLLLLWLLLKLQLFLLAEEYQRWGLTDNCDNGDNIDNGIGDNMVTI